LRQRVTLQPFRRKELLAMRVMLAWMNSRCFSFGSMVVLFICEGVD